MKQLPSCRLLFLCLFSILILLNPLILAQGGKNDWSSVQMIKHGSRLIVKTKTGRQYQGKLKGITEDSLSLAVTANPLQDVVVRKAEIAEIRKKSGAHTAGMATLLGGIGFAGGYGIGYGIGEAKGARFRPEYPTAAVGAAAGAIAGAIIGRKGQAIYKVP
jgi:hypothetical protein